MASGRELGWQLRRSDAFEVLGSDLELTSLVIIHANRDDLAAVDSERAAIFDYDAAPLAATHPQHDLITHLQQVTSGC
jgi:hypothetical protein